jgi:hypothetical protein
MSFRNGNLDLRLKAGEDELWVVVLEIRESPARFGAEEYNIYLGTSSTTALFCS